MEYHFTIDGRLAGMNEFIGEQRRNRYAGAMLKREQQEIVMLAIKHQLRGVHISTPVYIEYRWFEKDRRRDLDNISGFGHKVIQDALVACKVLQNDGWTYICGYSDDFCVDHDKPRIEITIREVERLHGRKTVLLD